MDSGIWDKTTKILKLDSRIEPVIFDILLSKMKEVICEDNVIVISCPDEYTLNLAKGQPLGGYIQSAINTVSGRNLTAKFIEEGDEKAVISSVVSENKVASSNNNPESSGISDDYTFSNFIVGDCNRFAHASAVSVSNNPGSKQRNPLYLWGNSGLGKTHLMKAIGYQITKNFPNMNVMYTTCEAFTNAYVACMNNKNYDAFRNKYRYVDVLLIDDIQFLIGKEGTQMEFFNTFESLINSGKQIVITSDKAPNNLTELDARLISRFQNGILMDIQPPDFETRKAIFISKIEKDHISLPDDVINYVCENVTSNIRELNGAYNILSSYLVLSNGEMDLDMTQNLLSSIISPNKKKYFTAEMIITTVSKYYDIPVDKLVGSARNKEIINARGVAMYLCRELLEGYSLEKIGSYFGNKKHSTVINSINNVEESSELIKEANDIKKRISDY